MASPPRVAAQAPGVASIVPVTGGAKRPKTIASSPQARPAVYCRDRSPDAESSALVGPVRQVDTVPTAAVSSDHAPQAMVTTLTGGAWPADPQHRDTLRVRDDEHGDRQRHDQLHRGLEGPIRHREDGRCEHLVPGGRRAEPAGQRQRDRAHDERPRTGGTRRPSPGEALSARNATTISAAMTTSSCTERTRSRPNRRKTPATMAITMGIGTTAIARRTHPVSPGRR
jgi:hypothetical protein